MMNNSVAQKQGHYVTVLRNTFCPWNKNVHVFHGLVLLIVSLNLF